MVAHAFPTESLEGRPSAIVVVGGEFGESARSYRTPDLREEGCGLLSAQPFFLYRHECPEVV